MLKHGMADLRPFYESDLRWLRHYGFNPLAPDHAARGGLSDEIHPLLAEDASGDRRLARPDHRHADPDRPGTGGRREPRRRARLVPHRPCDRGRAAPERRPSARLQGGHRRRYRFGRVRRAECAHRHEGGVRRARQLHPRHRHHAESRRNPRRARARACCCRPAKWASARIMPASSTCRRMRRSAMSYAAWAGLDDPVIEISVTPNRGDCFSVRGVARDLAAAGLGTLKPFAPAAITPAVRWRPTLADRFPRGLSVDSRPHHPRREELAESEMVAGSADLASACGRSTRWST